MADAFPSRPPTAHDVARLAGVSQSAVSRAFTKGASVSAKTREKIVAAASTLGYRPNILARSLTMESSKLVGMVVGNFDNPFFAAALDRFAASLSQHGLRTLLFRAEPNATVDEQVAELLSYRVRAVILLAVNLSSTLAAECARSGIPVVLFNRTTEKDQSGSTVTGDNAAGAAAIAARFVATGKRRIAFMAGYEDSSTSRQREAAFRAALAAAGRPEPRRAIGYYTRAGAIAATRTLFSDPGDRPDALFCANDMMAIAAIETMRGMGLEPGRDCAVAGFDDIAMASWPSFALTTYSQPIDAMVAQAVAFIMDEAAGQRDVVIAGELKLRETA